MIDWSDGECLKAGVGNHGCGPFSTPASASSSAVKASTPPCTTCPRRSPDSGSGPALPALLAAAASRHLATRPTAALAAEHPDLTGRLTDGLTESERDRFGLLDAALAVQIDQTAAGLAQEPAAYLTTATLPPPRGRRRGDRMESPRSSRRALPRPPARPGLPRTRAPRPPPGRPSKRSDHA